MTLFHISPSLLAGFMLMLLSCTSSNDKVEGKEPYYDSISEQIYPEGYQPDTLSVIDVPKEPLSIKTHSPTTKKLPDPSDVQVVFTPAERDIPSPSGNPVLDENQENKPKGADTPDLHSKWDDLLNDYVDKQGRVDYAGMLKEKAHVRLYLQRLSDGFPTPQTSRKETMAYWINAYNAFTIALILDHWPVKSIKDLDGGNPWDVKRIHLDGKSFSLNDIEHKILRKNFADPRIHFALVCAAVSCPPLMNRAWKANSLEMDLEQQTKAFIRNPVFNTFKPGEAHISALFDWYAGDFENVPQFLNNYLDAPLPKNVIITYLPYDWKINSQ